MAYSHCMGTGLGQVKGRGSGTIGLNILRRTGHTDPRQGKESGSIVSCCAGPIPCIFPDPVSMQYE